MKLQHTQLKGYLYLAKHKIYVKGLKPDDFLPSTSGIPFNIFQLKKTCGIYSQFENQMQEKNKISFENMKKLAKIIFPIAIYEYSEKIMDYHIEDITNIVGTIITLSLKKFVPIIEVSYNNALYIDQSARRYGKTPAEIMFPSGGYNDLEAYLFNSFISNTAIEKENREISRKRR